MSCSGLVAPASSSDQRHSRTPRAFSRAELPAARRVAGAFPVERRDVETRERLLRRVRAEFLEMPGLSLTLPQARRLFGASLDACDRILSRLADEGWLRKRLDGTFGRSDLRP